MVNRKWSVFRNPLGSWGSGYGIGALSQPGNHKSFLMNALKKLYLKAAERSLERKSPYMPMKKWKLFSRF